MRSCVEMFKTELEKRYRCFQFLFGGLISRVHMQPRKNEDHRFNLGKKGFNLRPDLTYNVDLYV